MERLLSTDEVAAILGVSARTVQRLVASGQLRPIYVRSLPRFTEAEIEAYCAAAFRKVA
jgi:excisionase family DNA binding protein